MEYNTDRLITAATGIVLALAIFAGGKIVFSSGIDNIGNLNTNILKTIDTQLQKMNTKEDTKTPFVFSYNDSNSTATVVSFKSPDVKKDGWTDNDIENTVIPARIVHNGKLYSVTEIGKEAFSPNYYYSSYIKTLTIENGIKKIDENAFIYAHIDEVNIPSSVTEIGNGAFRHTGVQSVKLNEGLKTIGEFAFDYSGDSDGITVLTIPKTVTSIGSWAFSNNKIKSLSLPEGLKTIGSGSFSGQELKNLTIPKSVTTIGAFAFGSSNGNHMNTLNLLPVDITSEGSQGYNSSVFSGNSVDTVTINSSYIGNGGLGTTSINKLIVGDTTTKIEHGAFSYQKINETNISNSVQFFGGGSFMGNNFKIITISKTAQIEDNAAFDSDVQVNRK